MAMPSLTRSATVALAALAIMTLVHLAVIVVAPDGALEDATQALLMPLLAVALLAAAAPPRGRLVLLVLVALVFSWLGDAVPMVVPDDLAFLAKVGCFFGAQVAFIAAFWPWRRHSVAARHPWAVLVYAAALAAILALVWRGAAGLLLPVVVYATTLTLMAVLATGMGPLAGVGGAVFMVSDAILAVNAFSDLALPHVGVWIMLTYVVGEVLIVLGVLSHRVPAKEPVTA